MTKFVDTISKIYIADVFFNDPTTLTVQITIAMDSVDKDKQEKDISVFMDFNFRGSKNIGSLVKKINNIKIEMLPDNETYSWSDLVKTTSKSFSEVSMIILEHRHERNTTR